MSQIENEVVKLKGGVTQVSRSAPCLQCLASTRAAPDHWQVMACMFP